MALPKPDVCRCCPLFVLDHCPRAVACCGRQRHQRARCAAALWVCSKVFRAEVGSRQLPQGRQSNAVIRKCLAAARRGTRQLLPGYQASIHGLKIAICSVIRYLRLTQAATVIPLREENVAIATPFALISLPSRINYVDFGTALWEHPLKSKPQTLAVPFFIAVCMFFFSFSIVPEPQL